jgi:hypothetical protein
MTDETISNVDRTENIIKGRVIMKNLIITAALILLIATPLYATPTGQEWYITNLNGVALVGIATGDTPNAHMTTMPYWLIFGQGIIGEAGLLEIEQVVQGNSMYGEFTVDYPDLDKRSRTAIPEPNTYVLLVIGLIAVGMAVKFAEGGE